MRASAEEDRVKILVLKKAVKDLFLDTESFISGACALVSDIVSYDVDLTSRELNSSYRWWKFETSTNEELRFRGLVRVCLWGASLD